MGIYGSEYTGAEHDLAIGRILGNKYGENEDPGCHLVGTTNENPQNLFELQRPGKYTIHFYYDMGPDNVPISIPFEGSSPIFMTVTVGRDIFKSDTTDDVECLYQQVMVGGSLYWRDMLHNDYQWREIILENRDIEIIDNLTSTRTDAALSANMGRELKYIIDNQQIGNMNLLNNSGLLRDDSGFSFANGFRNYISRDSNLIYNGRPNFKLDVNQDFVGKALVWRVVDVWPTNKDIFTGSAYVYCPTTISVSLGISLFVFDGSSNIDFASNKCDFTIPANEWTRIQVKTPEILKKIDPTQSFKLALWFYVNTTANNIRFALPKLEYGQYATEWMPSYYDMWCEFDNANFINEVLVDTDNLQEQDGLVYRSASNSYVNYRIATGGGGGFYTSYANEYMFDPHGILPDDYVSGHNELLWNVTWGGTRRQTYNAVVFYNKITKRWEKLFSPPLYAGFYPPKDIDTGWLDIANQNDIVSATLKYYDSFRHQWRPVSARATGMWYFGTTAPSDTAVMWIKTPDFIPHLYYNGTWEPLHAVWGRNISGS